MSRWSLTEAEQFDKLDQFGIVGSLNSPALLRALLINHCELIASLKSQLTEAQKDRDRLDWMETSMRNSAFGSKGLFVAWPWGGVTINNIDCPNGRQSIRLAIDAAMEAENGRT